MCRVVLCGQGMKVDHTPCAYVCIVVKINFVCSSMCVFCGRGIQVVHASALGLC